MWNYNQEDVNKEIGSDYLEESGCLKAKIVSVKMKSSNSSSSKGLAFEFETDKGIGRAEIWYMDKTGSEISFSTAILNQLCFMLQINPKNFKIYKKTEKFGEDSFENEFIKDFEGKEVGVFLEHYYNTYKGKTRLKFNIKGFFNPETKKTTSETKNGEVAKKYAYWEEKFKTHNIETVKPAKKQNAPIDDFEDSNSSDDFPFESNDSDSDNDAFPFE